MTTTARQTVLVDAVGCPAAALGSMFVFEYWGEVAFHSHFALCLRFFCTPSALKSTSFAKRLPGDFSTMLHRPCRKQATGPVGEFKPFAAVAASQSPSSAW